MSGKAKDLYGVYRALGRDAFLYEAAYYTDIIPETVENTLLHMEGTYDDETLEITEADRMLEDYINGCFSKSSIESDMQICQKLG